MDESAGPMTLNNESIKETMKMIQMQGQMQQQEVMTQVIRFSFVFLIYSFCFYLKNIYLLYFKEYFKSILLIFIHLY